MLTCKKPDRHEPRMTCGYPLPCPFHTVVVEDGQVTIPVNENIGVVAPLDPESRLGQIVKALEED